MTSVNKTETCRVLVADDDEQIRRFLQHALESDGMEAVLARDGEEALRLMTEQIGAVLLDLHMPRKNGLECLAELKERHPEVPCILVTAETDARMAVAAMKAGAFDYLTKPINIEELILLIRRAMRTVRLDRENVTLREALSTTRSERPWTAYSPMAKDILSRVQRIGRSDSTVLITGETGTGKSMLARMIHETSRRADAPFVTVSCAAVPRDLLEAELFGHEKGAFTGAVRERPGRMEIVADGTLFMDEIGDLPLAMQPKVLRALQEREFERVGGNRTHTLKARIIAATNRDLNALCDRMEFRRDLYYRLDVLRIHLPPLRERPEDVLGLARDFLGRLDGDHAPFSMASDACEALLRHPWPGNVRELQNVMERAVAFAESGRIGARELGLPPPEAETAPAAGGDRGGHLSGLSLREVERMALEQTLAACQGNKAETARRLGISEKSIYNKMKRFHLS